MDAEVEVKDEKEVLVLVVLPSLEIDVEVEGVVDVEEEEAKEVLVDVLPNLAVQRLPKLGGVNASWCSSSESVTSSWPLRKVYPRVALNDPEHSPRPRSVTDEEGRASLSRVVSLVPSLKDSLR
jgi:hypothetical protein